RGANLAPGRRACGGPELPIVASLDLHANVTARMLHEADALVSYRTYPHVDMADTGALAADLLQRRLKAARRAWSGWWCSRGAGGRGGGGHNTQFACRS